MNERFTPIMLRQVQALHTYATALTQEDLDTIAAVLQTAEQDPVLERMILEFHEAIQEDLSPGSLGEVLPGENPFRTPRLTENRAEQHSGNQGFPLMRDEQDHPGEPVVAASNRERGLLSFFGNRPALPTRPALRSHDPKALVRTYVAVLVAIILLSSFVTIITLHNARQAGPASIAASATVSARANDLVVIGSQNGLVLALRPSNGTVLWQYHAGRPINTLVVDHHVIYLETAYGDVAALRANDGSRLWKHDGGGYMGYLLPVNMFVDHGVVLVPEALYTIALRASDGAVLWQSRPTERSYLQGEVLPVALADGIAYLSVIPSSSTPPWRNTLQAVRASDGKLLWQYITQEYIFSNDIAAANKVVYVYAASGYVRWLSAFSTETGMTVWTKPMPPDDPVTHLTLDGPIIYLKMLGTSRICTYRASDGSALWCSLPIQTPDDGFVIMDDMLYEGVLHWSGTYEFTLIGLNVHDGTKRWSRLVPAESALMTQTYFGLHGVVYLATLHGIYAFLGSTGQQLWYTHPDDKDQLVIAGGSQ